MKRNSGKTWRSELPLKFVPFLKPFRLKVLVSPKYADGTRQVTFVTVGNNSTI